MLDKFLAPCTHEAETYFHMTENWHPWQSSVDEPLMSRCAFYSAFDRYLAGKDLFLLPTTRVDLERILRRYAYDAIHNAIARSSSQIQGGGYSRVCVSAATSIRNVLNTGDNAEILLALHQSDSKLEIQSPLLCTDLSPSHGNRCA